MASIDAKAALTAPDPASIPASTGVKPRSFPGAPAAQFALIATLCLAAALLDALLIKGSLGVVPLWLGTGTAFALLLRFGPNYWPALLPANLYMSFFLSELPPNGAYAMVFLNTAMPVAAVLFSRKWLKLDPAIRRTRDLLWIGALSVGWVAGGRTFFHTLFLALWKAIPWEDFGKVWQALWLTDATGAVLVVPFLLSWLRNTRRKSTPLTDQKPDRRQRVIEAIVIGVCVFSYGILLFVLQTEGRHLTDHPLAFLAFPLLMWPAMRFNIRGTTLALMVVSLMILIGVFIFFAEDKLSLTLDTLFRLQILVFLLAACALILAAATEERQEIELALLSTLVDLRVSRDAAEAANRAKSAFLAKMSHEFRTPLNAIIGYSEVMQLQMFGPIQNPRYLEYSGDILKSGKLLLSFIEDILDLAKIEAGKLKIEPAILPVADTIEACVKLVSNWAGGKNLTLETVPSAPGLTLFADQRAVTQILLNLLSNAIKFTPPGGTITLSAEATADGGTALTIADTGCGIPESHLDRVFLPFEQSNPSNAGRAEAGTGLGLAIIRGLVELHRGRIHIESATNKGTLIRITFPPAATGKGGPSPQPAAATQNVPSSSSPA